MTITIILTAVLLLVGMTLRLALPIFRWLYIPASVIAGFLGLLVVQIAIGNRVDENTPDSLIATAAQEWASWPGPLIAVVFAGMLLERQPSSLGQSLRRAGREGLMVWIIVLGQTTIGLLATWLLIGPTYNVPDAFGMLIETGWAGGHGTAAAMGQVFATERVGLPDGLDLGVMMATVGLVYGIVSGVIWINIGVRRGWTTRSKVDGQAAGVKSTPMGKAVVRADVLDPLLVQAVWLALSFGIGVLLQTAVGAISEWIAPPETLAGVGGEDQLAERTGFSAVISSFPLFIYTLFGGMIVRRAITAVGKQHLVDPDAIGRLTSTAMDLLVVAAIATLNLNVVQQNAGPIVILVLVAAIWTAICLTVLSRLILPKDHWFELGLINYGMSTGTTATGFVLLRMIDPELDSGAAEDYALAAPMSSPFIGGGMVTIGLPMLILGQFPLPMIVAALVVIVSAMIATGAFLGKDTP